MKSKDLLILGAGAYLLSKQVGKDIVDNVAGRVPALPSIPDLLPQLPSFPKLPDFRVGLPDPDKYPSFPVLPGIPSLPKLPDISIPMLPKLPDISIPMLPKLPDIVEIIAPFIPKLPGISPPHFQVPPPAKSPCIPRLAPGVGKVTPPPLRIAPIFQPPKNQIPVFLRPPTRTPILRVKPILSHPGARRGVKPTPLVHGINVKPADRRVSILPVSGGQKLIDGVLRNIVRKPKKTVRAPGSHTAIRKTLTAAEIVRRKKYADIRARDKLGLVPGSDSAKHYFRTHGRTANLRYLMG